MKVYKLLELREIMQDFNQWILSKALPRKINDKLFPKISEDVPNILHLPVPRKRPGNSYSRFTYPPALHGTSDSQLLVLALASWPRFPPSPVSSSACDPSLWYTGHTEAEEPACWISTCWYSGIAVKTLEWLGLHLLCNDVTKTWQKSEYTGYRTQWVFRCHDVADHLKRVQAFVEELIHALILIHQMQSSKVRTIP